MPSTRAKRTATSSSTKTTSKSASLAPLLETNSSSSDKKVKYRPNKYYEILFTYQGVESYIYFVPRKDHKAEGEKKFKQVIRDSGWKGAKLVKIHPQIKAIDPPLTKAQKDALRSRSKPKESNNTRRTRTSRKPSTQPKKVSGARKSTRASNVLETRPTRSKVSKNKLSKNK